MDLFVLDHLSVCHKWLVCSIQLYGACRLVVLNMVQNIVFTFFHEPLRSARGTAYTDGMHTVYPFHIYLLGSLYLVTVGVDAATFVEQHLAVGTLSAAHKKDKVVLRSERSDVGHAVGHLPTDGIKAAKGGLR